MSTHPYEIENHRELDAIHSPIKQNIFEWVRENDNNVIVSLGYKGNKMGLPTAKEYLSPDQFKRLLRHLRYNLTKIQFKKVQKSLIRLLGVKSVSMKKRVGTKYKTFNDSIENLQRIANAPEGVGHGGKRGPRQGESKKPTLRERVLQKQAQRYAEKRSILVVQWDHNGNPDHLYLRSNNAVLGAVEFKDPGKKPRKDQARKILELLNRMPVAVISDFKTFKNWLNIRIRSMR
jgi:hypothetical protein